MVDNAGLGGNFGVLPRNIALLGGQTRFFRIQRVLNGFEPPKNPPTGRAPALPSNFAGRQLQVPGTAYIEKLYPFVDL